MNTYACGAAWPLCLAFAVLASPLGAQTPGDSTARDNGQGTYAGPSFGVVIADVSGEPFYSSTLKLSGGVQLDVVREKVLIRTGAFYTGRGGRSNTGTRDEQFLEVPLLFGYRFPDDRRTRVFVMAGAQVGFQTACTLNGPDATADCRHEGHDVDYGVLAGGGVFLPLGKAHLVLDLRAMQGLREFGFHEGKNRGITIGVAYMGLLGGIADR